VAWEIPENAAFMINRYREATIALDILMLLWPPESVRQWQQG
jgi:hypothetical protein